MSFSQYLPNSAIKDRKQLCQINLLIEFCFMTKRRESNILQLIAICELQVIMVDSKIFIICLAVKHTHTHLYIVKSLIENNCSNYMKLLKMFLIILGAQNLKYQVHPVMGSSLFILHTYGWL